ncbi:uncharacterized protein LOC125664437 [Ostrea edulis]|uniref:uncharacterized protein LOC125664437 n=1 Tax=Ostrea edulis TaxID=37623 RepID=UPI0024AF549A|nr:uncharacterized protein LOC125664437 [Ostrea edulis]
MERETYVKFSVSRLKDELKKKGATTRGRKADLIDRLKAYDRNKDFKNDPIHIPEPLEVDWPTRGFQQLQESHKEEIPEIGIEQIDMYFVHRLAGDRQSTGDVKAIEKGRLLVESDRVLAVSYLKEDNSLFFTGIVGAAMKTKVTYNFKLKFDKNSGDILNSHCECPAGRGPHGTCKHLAAVAIVLLSCSEGKGLRIQRSCTENLQTFHKPKHSYSGSPVKAEDLPRKRNLTDDFLNDPRPEHLKGVAGYPDRVRNMVLNHCAETSDNLTYRYLIEKANIQAAVLDHDYLERPFTEYWVQRAVEVTADKVVAIEEQTRGQASSNNWFKERSWRITASRFGDICLATDRRNRQKLCESLYQPSAAVFRSEALVHGSTYETRAIRSFERETGQGVQRCGFFVDMDRPYLGASPDGLVGNDALIEVKCPFAGRFEKIQPGKYFPYLTMDSVTGEMKLKPTSKYFFQIQGQMLIAKNKFAILLYTLSKICSSRKYILM